jgi:hypothetical protein
MSIIQFRPQKIANAADDGVIRKVINGEVVEYVNLDALPPEELHRYLEAPEDR